MRDYGLAVACWSLGCVFAELILEKGRALFNGDVEARQIKLIYQLCGSPIEENWDKLTQLKFWNDLRPKEIYTRQLKEYLVKETKGKYPNSLIDLID